MDDERYGIEELAEAGGVSRRTVRYYVQEGLLPAPLGAGRGAHYGRQHREQLERVKALQEKGLTLEEVRRELARPEGEPGASGRTLWVRAAAPMPAAPTAASMVPPPVSTLAQSLWTRLEVLPGVEIHLSGRYRALSAREVWELAEWFRQHVVRVMAEEE